MVLFLFLPFGLAGDDYARFEAIEALLHDGVISDTRYSLVGPIVSSPILLLGEVVRSPEWWASRFNLLLVATSIVVAYGLLRRRVDPALLRRLFLLLLFASLLTNRLRDYNAEVLTAVLVALGLAAARSEQPRSRVLGWSAIVIGAVNTPAAIGGVALVALVFAVARGRLRYLLVPVAAIALVMLEAWIRRGDPLVTGYEGDAGFRTVLPYSGQPGFSYPFLLGVLSLLFSFGRGLMYFAPGIVLGLVPAIRRELGGLRFYWLATLVFLAGLILVYAKWWAWYGGFSWGPRFLVFAALPASLVLAARLRRSDRRLVADLCALLVLALSAWVGASGAVFDMGSVDVCRRDDFALEALCWYVPEFSPLWRPMVSFPALSGGELVLLGYFALVFFYLAAPLARSGMVEVMRGVALVSRHVPKAF